MLTRAPTVDELRLLEYLLLRAEGIVLSKDWQSKLKVGEMDDGGMGNLLLFPDGAVVEEQLFGEQVAEYQFTDLDGIEVFASLNLDQNGTLFELDIWKTNFGHLIRIPERFT